MDSLENKYQLYLELNKRFKSPQGFQSSDKCDSLLFTALSACNPDNPANILAAYNKTASQFHRRPLSLGKCCGCWDPSKAPKLKQIFKLGPKDWYLRYKSQGSTISRDMLLGLAYYSYYRNKPDIAKKVIKSAIKGYGRVGKGDVFRTGIRLPLLLTFYMILYKLTKPKSTMYKLLKLFSYFPVSGKLTGYRAHLEALHILLRADIIGVGKKQRQALASYNRRQPRNPLFLYANGRIEASKAVLSDSLLWPDTRLPTSRDRKAEWLPQRDYGPDWLPSDKKDIDYYNGADFLFLYWLINKKDKDSGK